MTALLALLLSIASAEPAAPSALPSVRTAVGPAGETPGSWFYADRARSVAHLVTRDGDLYLGPARVWRTGDLIVQTDHPAVLRAIQDDPRVAYAEALHDGAGVYRVLTRAGVDEIALSALIAALPTVGFAHPDLEVELALHTLNDPLLEQAWHLHNTGQGGGLPGVDVGAFAAWNLATGEGQRIAILDTGLDADHPDLAIVADFDAIDGANAGPDLDYEGHGHGTAMAGVAAAVGDNGIGTAGIAPDAALIGVRMIGTGATLSSIFLGVTFALDEGATVLNNSWGFSARECQPFPPIGSIFEAFDLAEREGRGGLGAAVAMSYGNGGCDASGDGIHLQDSVISVGAASDVDRRIGYSNFGATLDIMGFAGGDGRPGLVTTDVLGAAGYNTAEDGDYWFGGSGTSSAAASVSGVLALMFHANPRLTAAQARRVLCDTAVKAAWDDAQWDENGFSPRYGCGRIDAAAAVYAVWSELPIATPEPPGDLVFGAARLRWNGAHPRGEPLRYRVRLIPILSGDPVEFEVDEPWIDLEGRVAIARPYTWEVTAIDPWGDGHTAPGEEFTVEPAPVEPERSGACASAGLPASGGLGLGSLLLVLAGRRSSRERHARSAAAG